MAHVEKCQHQLLRFSVGQPCHVFVDGVLDGVAGIAQIIAQTVTFGETKQALLSHQHVEILFQAGKRLTQRIDVGGVHVGARIFDGVQAVVGQFLRLVEHIDQRAVRTDGEILGCDAHDGDCDLEFAARLGELMRTVDRREGPGDLVLAGDVGDAVGDEADHRDQRQNDNAGPEPADAADEPGDR